MEGEQLSGGDRFLAELTDKLTAAVASSSILQAEVANSLRRDDAFMVEVIKRVDPEMLARALAQEIVFRASRPANRQASSSAEALWKVTARDAQERAIEIAAQRIADEVRNV